MIMRRTLSFILACVSLFCAPLSATEVSLGLEQLFAVHKYHAQLKGKRIGLVTNHTGIDGQMQSNTTLFAHNASKYGYRLVALFGPEHGIKGQGHAGEKVDHGALKGIPVYSLHGATRRPTKEMLKGIDLLIFDIQDVGARSYTYLSTLCYCMEEAAKHSIKVMVLDRPNPINGLTIDGPMLDEKWRSFVGYIDVPYCHGMTFGELAHYFNEHYRINCSLTVVPMRGWHRSMSFADTGLTWVPTSPHIPEADTPIYYPSTGILGELQIVNIGVGYTLPFKLVGAPWIDAEHFADALNSQNFPGVTFLPFHYRPFYGSYSQKDCQGVLIRVTNTKTYKPVATQYLILGVLKTLYPDRFKKALAKSQNRKEMFNKVNGTEEVYRILTTERYVVWKLRGIHEDRRKAFAKTRKKYLNPSYS